MEVAPEASTATGMAFTSWGMSRGKVCGLHLRLHCQQGLQRGPSPFAGGKFAHRPILPIVRTNWGMEVTPGASTACLLYISDSGIA